MSERFEAIPISFCPGSNQTVSSKRVSLKTLSSIGPETCPTSLTFTKEPTLALLTRFILKSM